MNVNKPYKADLTGVASWNHHNARLVWRIDPYLWRLDFKIRIWGVISRLNRPDRNSKDTVPDLCHLMMGGI